MYFTFKGITSTSLGIIVESMSNFQKPERRSDMKFIDGKAGASVTEYGYAPYIIKAVIGVTKNADIDTIIAWLDGTGVLICSDDPLKYRDVKVLGDIDYEKLLRFKKAKVEFYVPIPFRKLLTDTTLLVTKAQGTVTYVNAGTADSYPLLFFEGSSAGGPSTITINSVSITFNFPTEYGYVHIDCQSKTIWKDFENDTSYYLLSGIYPKLKPGNNEIYLTGVQEFRVTITKRTSYL